MIKTRPVTTTVGDAIENGIADLKELGDEMMESWESIPENLQSTERATILQATAETLQGLDELSVPDAVVDLQVTGLVPYETRANRATRRLRCEAAVALLQIAYEGLNAHLDAIADKETEEGEEEPDTSDIETLVQEVEDIIGQCSELDFPGHRG